MIVMDNMELDRRTKVRELVLASGKSIRAFERDNNLGRGSVWRIINGKNPINYKRAKLLAQITGTSFEEWIEE